MPKRKKPKIKPKLVVVLGAVILFLLTAAYFLTADRHEPSITIYFIKNDQLVPVQRPLRANEAPLTKAVGELLKGPTLREKKDGVISLVPAGTRLINSRQRGSTVALNFNRSLGHCSGGSDRLKGMIMQIIYTATGILGVERVDILIDGEKDVVLGGEGLVLDHPLSRRDLTN